MNITNIKIFHTPSSGRMKAIVSVTFDHQIAVHDIKIIEGPDRLFLAMPSRKTPDGTFRDIVHPISAEARAILETAIMERYEETVASGSEAADSPESPAEEE